MRVDLNTIECSTGTADANGATWYVTEIEGWWGVPVIQSIDNPTGHPGGILGESKHTHRPVAVKGITKAPSESTFWASIDTLMEQTRFLLKPFHLTVHESIAKRLSVILAREQRVAFVGKNAFEWEIELVGLWPYKESVTATSVALSTSMTITNGGQGPAHPTVTLTTGQSGLVMTNSTTGQTVELVGTIPTGTVIDFRKRTIIGPSGEDLYSLVKPGADNWWNLNPGSNAVSINGTGTLEYRESWL